MRAFTADPVERVEVPPLSLEAVRELASAHEADGDAIHALTGGNPFFVTELAARAARRWVMPRRNIGNPADFL